MRSLWLGILTCAAMLVACGDDDSDFATRPSDGSSSSRAKSSSSAESSSSSVTLAIPCKTETEDNCEYGSLTDDRDGQTYRTVKIGDQWWMAENLNFETDNSFCYNNSAEYCDKYGRLYTWGAAMDSSGTWSSNGKGCGYCAECTPAYPVRGVCPEGWHLPSIDEWYTLILAVGDSTPSGLELKSASGWRDGNGTDDFGFSALPAGYMRGNPIYSAESSCAHFWSSTTHDDNYMEYEQLCYDTDVAYQVIATSKYEGKSVRCVKD
ncbi:MAG: fibrobacter succinogenes major paralogous domain-containing protein [Fibrobacter sp.]|nr:fibrobacter succinogenes major paralogous domain-containing protein [Fibrobacter sp.]